MTHNILVHHAQLVEMHGMVCWVQHREFQPEGAPAYHLSWITPHDMFETIAAELDIDPDDWDTLLDVELYRAVLPHYDDHADGSWLYDAPSVALARKTHLGRIAAVKGDGRAYGVPGLTPENRRAARQLNPPLLDSGAEDPLLVIRRHSPMSPEHMAVKRAHRDHHRQGHAVRRKAAAARADSAAAGQLPRRATPSELLGQLLGPDPTPRGRNGTEEN